MIHSTSINEFKAKQNVELLDKCIAELAEGKTEAMTTLYHITSVSVYSFALSILKNAQDAEDVLHDSYINIYSAAAGYRSAGKPMAWILTITKNLCFRNLQERKAAANIPREDRDTFWGDTADLLAEDKIIISDLMGVLSDEERHIVILHAVSGFKHWEIAELLSLPLPTVLSKYHRAKKKMKIHWDRKGGLEK